MASPPGERGRRLEALGYPLDRCPKPGAIYRPVVIVGNLAFVAGAIALDGDLLVSRGKVPSQVELEAAARAAALCAANNLRMARQALGSLGAVKRVVRLTGYVNSDPDFDQQHLVINGASQLLLDVLGDDGLGARSALGMAQLPLGSSVEVETILEVRPPQKQEQP